MIRIHAKAAFEDTLIPLHDAVIMVIKSTDGSKGTISACGMNNGPLFKLAKELPMDEIDELFWFIKDQMTLPNRADGGNDPSTGAALEGDAYQVIDLAQHLEYFRAKKANRTNNAKAAGALAGRHLTKDERVEAAAESLPQPWGPV